LKGGRVGRAKKGGRYKRNREVGSEGLERERQGVVNIGKGGITEL
jgi:hypothetical protein